MLLFMLFNSIGLFDPVLFEKAQKQLRDSFAMADRNKKNDYLLGGKIYCDCGKRRTGEGPQKGKHLYYRCSDRTHCSPLPPNCRAKGINARIADKIVWSKVTELMTSPDLMQKQIQRWIKSKKSQTHSSVDDISLIEKEIGKLKEQEERYSKAYGAGVFSIEQLKEYMLPIKERLSSLELQKSKTQIEKTQTEINLPSESEINKFADKVKLKLDNLSFEIKKGIIMNILDKVVGNREHLQIYGYIPITANNYVESFTSYRNCRSAKCGEKHLIQCAHKKKRIGG